MGTIERLRHEIETAHISRRTVVTRAMAMGLTAPVIAGLLAACGGDDDESEEAESEATMPAVEDVTEAPSESEPTVSSDDTEPTESGDDTEPTESGDDTEPTESGDDTEPTTVSEAAQNESTGRGRGAGDVFRIIYTNGPNILNPHLASGGHESQVASIVLEPLLQIDPDGNLIPDLAAEVPSLENGGLAEDGLSVTYKLRDDVVWSDGEPFTADDVRFTWEYITHPDASTTSSAVYGPIQDVEVVDMHTVTIHFAEPNAAWFWPFSSGRTGEILPKHLLASSMGADAVNAEFNLKPIGTGPYKIAEFRPGDLVVFEINENYRFADKPYFQRVEFVGGAAADQAAQAVILTGEADYSFFIQVEKTVLEQMLQDSDQGELIVIDGNWVERIYLNLSDPNKEVDGERSKLGVPHPFQSDRAVREAFTYVIDRDTIATELYGDLGKPTPNTLVAPPRFTSPNTSYEFNVEKAGELLDAAGWLVQDGVRKKDGVQIHILYQTSLAPIRQKTQEIVKQAMDSLNIPVEIKAIPGSVFFSTDAGNPDTMFHFYADWEEQSTGPNIPYPIDYMIWYKSNEPESDIPQQANGWTGRNIMRWISEEFNTLYEQALSEFDPEKQAELFIGMNDLIVKEDIVEIPLIHRAQVSAKNSRLRGNNLSTWTTDFWDIQNWYFDE